MEAGEVVFKAMEALSPLPGHINEHFAFE